MINADFFIGGEDMANKKFTLTFDVNANIGPIKSAAAELQKAFNGINLSNTMQSGIDRIFSNLTNEISKFEGMASKGFSNMADVGKAERSFEKIVDLIRQLSLKAKEVKGIDPNKLLPEGISKKVEDLQKQYLQVQKVIKDNAKVADQAAKQYNKTIDSEIKKVKQLESQLAEAQKQQNKMNLDYGTAKNVLRGAQSGKIGGKLLRQQETAKSELDAFKEEHKGQKLSVADSEELFKLQQAYENAKIALKDYNDSVKQAKSVVADYNKNIADNAAKQQELKAAIDASTKSEQEARSALQQLAQAAEPEQLTELRQALADIQGVKLDDVSSDMEEISKIINNLTAEQLQKIISAVEQLGPTLEKTNGAAENGARGIREFVEQGHALQTTADEIDTLKNRLMYFFSIGNAVQLFKRAIRSAIETVKELDETMTQTAVVTKYSIADMWKQLPQYSQAAASLGATINDLYKATTLYYQQGLDTNAAMSIGIETLKMSRIANIDAAEATDLMTAALRGFNMELNDASATYINDIYSNLAAHTASNTLEIGTAMSKTASIAANANMDFKVTAALLSQIIETTREAPETAGTAMKTIIARFTEVKKLFSEGQLTGTDEEGESIEINKIDKALKTVGISLKDFLNGSKGLDDIFLELSKKWSTLDLATQRYIATMAAGSRQQSRFLAMMSNYSRTMELVDIANNSAGASQEQFEKTLDSMSAKLNQLKDAWNNFLMGLANNEILKAGIDTLTKLLETINSIIDGISGGSGLIKSIASLGVAFGALKLGKSILGGGLAKMGAKFGAAAGLNVATQTKTGFIQGLKDKIATGKEAGYTGFGSLFRKEIPNKIEIGKDIVGNWDNLTQNQKQNLMNAPFGNFTNLEDQSLKQRLNLSFGEAEFKAIGDSTKIAEIKQYRDFLNEGNYDKAIEGAKNLGIEINTTEKMASAAGKSMVTDFQSVSVAAAAVGVAISAITSALEKDSGPTKATEAFKSFGSALMMLPMIFMAVQAAAKAFGADLTATILNIPIVGWVAAVITALIALIGILSAVIETDSEKHSRLAEETEQAQKAAEDAKSAYDDLKSSLDSLDDANNTLKELTYGTREWADAILEVNKQVLDLVQLYPQLASAVGKGEFGQLTIDPDAIEKLVQQQFVGVQTSQAVSILSLVDKTVFDYNSQIKDTASKVTDLAYAWAENNGADSQLRDNARVTYNKFLENYNNEDYEATTNAILEAIKQNNLEAAIKAGDYNNKQLEQVALEFGLGVNNLVDIGREILAIESTRITTENSISSQLKAMLTSGLPSELNNSPYADTIIGGLADKYSKSVTEDIENEKKNLDLQVLATELNGQGYTIQNISGGKETAEEIWAALSGQSLESVQGLKLNLDRLVALIAKQQVASKYQSSATEITKNIQGISDKGTPQAQKQARMLTALVSGDFTNLNKEELASLNFDTDSVRQQLKEANFSEELINSIIENFDPSEAEGQRADLTEKFTSYIMDAFSGNGSEKVWDRISDVTKGRSFAETESITDFYQIAASQGGEAGFNAVDNVISQILKDADSIDDTELSNFFNTIDDYDFESNKGIEEFLQDVKELDPAFDQSGKTIDEWRKEFQDAFKNRDAFGLTTFKEELKSALDIQDDLRGRESYRFNEDDYQALIAALPQGYANQFLFNGQDYVYVGGTMEELAAAVEANTLALLGNTEALLQEAIEAGQDFAEGVAKGQNVFAGETKEKYDLFVSGEMTNAKDIEHFYKTLEIDLAGGDIDDLMSSTYGQTRLIELYQEQAEHFRELGTLIAQLDTIQKSQDIAGLNGEKAALRGASEEQVQGATLTEAEKAGYNANEILNYANALEQANENLKDLDGTATRVALANTKLNSGLSKLISSYKGWTALIDKNGNMIENMTGDESAIFQEFKHNVNEMLNLSKELPDNFYKSKENLDLIKQAAEGNVKAFGDLQKAAAVETLKLELDTDGITDEAQGAINELIKLIQNTEIPDLEPGVDLSKVNAGTQGLVDACNQMIKAGKLTAQQVSAAFAAMGFTATVQMKTETLKIPQIGNMIQASGDTYGTVMANRGKEAYTQTADFTYPAGLTVTSNGYGSGGISGGNISAGKGNAGGGGGGSSEDNRNWKNPYDKYYNAVEKLNELLRQRNKLEKEYDRLAQLSNTSIDQMTKNLQKQLDNLTGQLDVQNLLIAGKTEQITNAANATNEVKEGRAISYQQSYANAGGAGSISQYGWYDKVTHEVNINWDKLEALQSQDAEQGKIVEAYIGYLESLAGDLEKAEDAIEEIRDSVWQITMQAIENRNKLIDKVADILYNNEKDRIDQLKDLYDTINTSNQRVLDGLKESIDLSRQIRDNTKTEEEMEDMRQRLAYLRMDTSGANDLEILALEKQLKEQEENYTDQLIDQKLDQLSKDNQLAAEQREREIEILNNNLEYLKEIKEFEKVADAMNASDIAKLIKGDEGFNDSTLSKQVAIQTEINELINKGFGTNAQIAAGASIQLGQKYTAEANGQKYSFTYNKDLARWEDTAKGVYIKASALTDEMVDLTHSSFNGVERLIQQITTSAPKTSTGGNVGGGGGGSNTSSSEDTTESQKRTSCNHNWEAITGIGSDGKQTFRCKKCGKTETRQVIDPITLEMEKNSEIRAKENAKKLGVTNIYGKKPKPMKYASGGLADYTGPAWLDGTPSKPEYILNPRETENFFQLKDILADLLKGSSNISQSTGDTYFDIHIDVDRLTNDYDVEQVADKVVQFVTEKARYRNGNVINMLR